MKTQFSRLAAASLVILWAGGAWAAQIARVKVTEAQVYEKPTTSSRVVGRLKKGTPVATSNSTRSGFYRMKTRSGLLGWISESEVVVVRKAGQKGKASSAAASSSSSSSFDKSLTLQLKGGLSLFKVADFNSALDMSGSGISNGIGFGMEILYPFFSPKFKLGLRVESFSKALIVKLADEVPEKTFNVNTSALPVMVGASYEVMAPSGYGGKQGFGIDAGLFAGLAMGAQVETVYEQGTGDNVVTYGKSAMTILPRVDFRYLMGNGFGIVGEAGYRLLSIAAAEPTVSGDVDGLYGTPPVALGVDLSGPVLGLGVSYSF